MSSTSILCFLLLMVQSQPCLKHHSTFKYLLEEKDHLSLFLTNPLLYSIHSIILNLCMTFEKILNLVYLVQIKIIFIPLCLSSFLTTTPRTGHQTWWDPLPSKGTPSPFLLLGRFFTYLNKLAGKRFSYSYRCLNTVIFLYLYDDVLKFVK